MNDTALPVPSRGFDEAEFTHRCASIQKTMREQTIDILWLSTQADIQYLTGFITPFWQSPTRPWYLLLPQSGKPVAVIPSIGQACMQRTWVTDIRTWSSPDPFDDGVTLLVDSIRELSGPTPCIGVPMARETHVRACLNDQLAIRSALAGAVWVDSSAAIRSARHIKSKAEIDKLSFICEVTSRTFAQVPDIIHTGMTEAEAFRAFKVACLRNGADDCAYLVGASRVNGYEDIISPPGDQAISAGDVLILDTGCIFDGYYADFDRNFAFKHVDNATQEAHQRVWDATESGLACIKPGVRCSDVFHAMNSIMLSDDDSASTESASVGRMGHGLGIELTETPSLAAFDETVLQEGMVITLEPSLGYSPGKMMVHEENIVITANGYDMLSQRAPRDIPIIT
ncbi:MAG: M24 family metallopeptidase [Granulosicoccus sp.]